jgi:DNA-directed RNA polymerase specialized sigma24 family protein
MSAAEENSLDGRHSAERRADGRLDPSVDFERYRKAACKKFVAMARTLGHHAFHDLDDLAEDFYDDFWVDWLEKRSRDRLSGPPVPYIANAMMNKLLDHVRRGRSVRPPQLVHDVESELILDSFTAKDLDPAEKAILQEELSLAIAILQALPPRERVTRLAVIARTSKKKDAPLAGYKLAASLLRVSERTAKKLSLGANQRIRDAREQIEAGTWCERWARSIEAVAAGEEGESGFSDHARYCLRCQRDVLWRRQAAQRAIRLPRQHRLRV